ncbi:hypothetical protein ACVGXX_00285, partial [Enterobacter intestinihominis]
SQQCLQAILPAVFVVRALVFLGVHFINGFVINIKILGNGFFFYFKQLKLQNQQGYCIKIKKK